MTTGRLRGGSWQKIRRQVLARKGPCFRCGQPIDYQLPYLNETTGRPDPDAATVEHVKPVSTHPQLATDPTNLTVSHLSCNLAHGNRPTTTTHALYAPGVEPSEDW